MCNQLSDFGGTYQITKNEYNKSQIARNYISIHKPEYFRHIYPPPPPPPPPEKNNNSNKMKLKLEINKSQFQSEHVGGHGGRVATLWSPTSEARVRFPGRPQVGKAGSCLLLVSSVQYRTLTNCMYWFSLPF